MNITLDIILLAVLVISFVIGYKKRICKIGLENSRIGCNDKCLLLALKAPTVNFLAGSALANNISTKISGKCQYSAGGGVDIAETLNLPGIYSK